LHTNTLGVGLGYMKDLETMQREGRKTVDSYANAWGWHHKVCSGHQHFPACPVIHLENDLDQHTANVWKAAQESAYKEIEAVFIKQVPPHAFDLEDGVWIKRLLNKAFKNNKHE